MAIQLNSQHVGGITVSTLTIDRPPLNILDIEHCRDVTSCLKEVHADDRARVLIIRGSGKCFSAGVDIEQHTATEMPELLPAFHEIFHQLLKLRAFTVAAIHGHCLGGAAELALACDRVLADESASVGLPEMSLGCYPPVAIPLFPTKLPHGKAIEMMIGGQEAGVEELMEAGVVDKIVPTGQLDRAIEEELKIYSGKSPAILGMLADLIHGDQARTWGARIDAMEKEYLDKLLPHPDVAEGIAAFLEKRKPNWADPDERPNPLEALDIDESTH